MRTPEQTSQLLLERAPWDAIDDEHDRRIPFDSPHESRDLLARMVAERTATLHHVMRDGARVGFVITRVDVGTAGRELVVVAASCRASGSEPLSPLLADACEALARAEHCCCIRFHTVRPALARYVCEREGYRISEIVLRKTLT